MKMNRPRVRASQLNLGRLCPAYAWRRGESAGNTYMQLGTIGHKFYELMVTKGRAAAAEHLKESTDDPSFRRVVAEGWNWLLESGALPTSNLEIRGDADYRIDAEQQVHWLDQDLYEGTGTVDLVVANAERAWVADYKFYWAPREIPYMTEDLQMYAYGVGIAQLYKVPHVTVVRANMVGQRYDRLDLHPSLLELSRRVLLEYAADLWDRRMEWKPGQHCQRCPQRVGCIAHNSQAEWVTTKEIAPYEGGSFTEQAAVLRFLLAAPIIERRLKDGLAAAEQWVRKNGPVGDLASGKQFQVVETAKDAIVDPVVCIRTVAPMIGKELVPTLVRTTKGALEDAMKAAKIKPAERREILDDLRARGAIVKHTGERVEWRKPPKHTPTVALSPPTPETSSP